MEISFQSNKLAKVCCSAKELQAKHGKRMAEKIQQRLMELQAVETLADMRELPAAHCHGLGPLSRPICFPVHNESLGTTVPSYDETIGIGK